MHFASSSSIHIPCQIGKPSSPLSSTATIRNRLPPPVARPGHLAQYLTLLGHMPSPCGVARKRRITAPFGCTAPSSMDQLPVFQSKSLPTIVIGPAPKWWDPETGPGPYGFPLRVQRDFGAITEVAPREMSTHQLSNYGAACGIHLHQIHHSRLALMYSVLDNRWLSAVLANPYGQGTFRQTRTDINTRRIDFFAHHAGSGG